MNQSTIKTQIYTSASWYTVESVLFNSWCQGVVMGHNRVKYFYICFDKGKFLKIFSRNHWAKKVQIYLQGDLMQNQVVKVMVPEQLGPQKRKVTLYVFPWFVNTKYRSQQCVKRNHNPKGNYKIECRATRTSDKCEGRIRCREGVSIPCWPVTPAVSPISRLGDRKHTIRWIKIISHHKP
jgi:hypothetical protein